MVPATQRTTAETTTAPTTANADTAPSRRPRVSSAKMPAALAPRLTPTMSGLASGLRSSIWKRDPAEPRASPTRTASTARGSLLSIRMKVETGTCSPKRIRKKSGTVKV